MNLTRNNSSAESVYVGENNLDESLGIDTQDGPQQADHWPITEVAVSEWFHLASLPVHLLYSHCCTNSFVLLPAGHERRRE